MICEKLTRTTAHPVSDTAVRAISRGCGIIGQQSVAALLHRKEYRELLKRQIVTVWGKTVTASKLVHVS